MTETARERDLARYVETLSRSSVSAHRILETPNQTMSLTESATRVMTELVALRARVAMPSSDNPLQEQLLDLITLMPDTQTQELLDYILTLREIRKRRDA